MKSIEQLTPQELRTIVDLKDQIDLILNNSVKDEIPTRPCLHVKPHWTKTPRGRRIMRRKMLARWRKGAFNK